MENNELCHYGVLGMKWGVRRTQTQLSRAKGRSSSDESHDDYKKAHSSKNVKTMSDAELRNRLNRIQMERQYSQLSDSNVGKGKEYAQKIMKAGTTIAAVTTTALTIYKNYGNIKAIIEKKG